MGPYRGWLARDRRLRVADDRAMTDSSIWRVHGSPLLPPVSSGPLDGLSVAVKDLFAVGGFPVGAGNPRWLAQAEVEAADAWAVHALRTAGAAVAGIAQTDELAFSLSGANVHYGTPPNPAAHGLVTGGSTSGPAAAGPRPPPHPPPRPHPPRLPPPPPPAPP